MASAHQEPTPAAGAAESREIIVGPAILFTPANRRDFIPKAAARADMVILDLEDGAGRADREEARANIAASGLDPKTTIVRVGGPQLDAFAADCEFVRQTPFTTVMVPKLRGEIPPELAGHGLSIIAQIETPGGRPRGWRARQAPGRGGHVLGCGGFGAPPRRHPLAPAAR